MLLDIPYDRRAAVRYALYWAYGRNPRYYDFEEIGGDCTNFVSQCLYAGCGVMNYSKPMGWYYNGTDDRSPSWTGVEFLREFLLGNKGAGVYGSMVALEETQPGDVIMLCSEGVCYHSLIVSGVFFPSSESNIFVCSHSFDRRNARLSDYRYDDALFIHINGARLLL